MNAMAGMIQMEHFVYNPDTIGIEWPRWYLRFEIFLKIQKLDLTKLPDAELALQHLIHVGGDKILDIYMAVDDKTTLVFKTFVDTLNLRFLVVNARIGIFVFRDCKQGADESLYDFSTRLRLLAKAAGIANDKMDAEILSVISQNTHTHAIRMKSLDPNAG